LLATLCRLRRQPPQRSLSFCSGLVNRSRLTPTPSGEQVHPGSGWVRFFALQGQGDPDTVVTFGFFDGTREEMEGSQRDQASTSTGAPPGASSSIT